MERRFDEPPTDWAALGETAANVAATKVCPGPLFQVVGRDGWFDVGDMLADEAAAGDPAAVTMLAVAVI